MAEVFNLTAFLDTLATPEVDKEEEEQQVVDQPEIETPEEYNPTAFLDELSDKRYYW